MKLCGHTMGMPDKSVFEALDFCASLGLEGIEIRCAANGHLDPETVDLHRLELIAAAAHRAGVAIACLTPYYKDFSSPEAAAATLAGLHTACQVAEHLDCRIVRAMGGIWPAGERDRDDLWERTVAGLQQAADLAIQHNVRLALENHSGTLTQTAEDTVAMVRQVDRPNSGILMDHYWVVAAHGCQLEAGAPTDLLDAVRLQAPYVIHCHCKGLLWQPDGKPQASFLDEGVIDWQPILRILQEHGYDGYLSDEYEKFWRPELPEPEEGMARNARALRQCLEQVGPASVPLAAPCGIITGTMPTDECLSGEQVARQVEYWLELAEYDLETGRAMLASRRLLYVAFMCHQTMEKALKALYVAHRRSIPPRIHALVALAQKAGAHDDMSPAQQDTLETLDPMNIECRYPAERSRLLAALTAARCEAMLAETEELLAWIRLRLSSM